MFMRKPKDVNSYIKTARRDVRAKLVQLRRVIKATAPRADEGISYGMPYYEYKGALAYFAAFKSHVSLFVPPPVIEEHRRELKAYETTKSSIHFQLDKPLPYALVRKMVRARMKKNEEKRK
jgi:uncharacterized protein YdhG (YjbR/CyaY superfamily)